MTKKKSKVTIDNSNIFKYWYTKLFKFNTYNQNLNIDNPDRELGLNVYGFNGKVKDFVKKQNRIHKIMKYCILVPGMKFIIWIIGKHLTHNVPDTQEVKNGLKVENKQYINARIFDKVVEKSVKDWHNMFLCKGVGESCKSNIELSKNYLKNISIKLVLNFKKFLLTFVCNDTSYLTLFDMISYNYAKEITSHYTGDINHLLYNTASINEIKYFVIRGMIPPNNIDLVSQLVEGSIYVQQVEENEVEHVYHLTNGKAHYFGVVVKKPDGAEIKGLIKPEIK